MPIHGDEHGNMTITGAGIPLYRLLALRSAVQLEAKGLRMSRRSMTALACRELKCKRKEVLAALDAAIERQGKLVQAETAIESAIDQEGGR
jgi:hypothetical protein